jgi:hypothetical protein
LAKYSAAITPDTANTVMDRAIATSLRMPRAFLSQIFPGDVCLPSML